MSTTTQADTQFHNGDWVGYGQGRFETTARILADYGPLGAGGHRLYRVGLEGSNEEPVSTIDLPERMLRAVDDRTAAIMNFLTADQMLVKLLVRNIDGGSNQPRGWMKVDPQSGVQVFYQETPSGIGGRMIPFGAVEGGLVFAPKIPEVVSFLGGFGLTESQARAVISTVGTYPD